MVGIIARLTENGALKTPLPQPFNLARTETSGKVLGKHISHEPNQRQGNTGKTTHGKTSMADTAKYMIIFRWGLKLNFYFGMQ